MTSLLLMWLIGFLIGVSIGRDDEMVPNNPTRFRPKIEILDTKIFKDGDESLIKTESIKKVNH